MNIEDKLSCSNAPESDKTGNSVSSQPASQSPRREATRRWQGTAWIALTLFVVACATNPSASDLNRAGKELLEQGRVVEAVEKLGAASNIEPTNVHYRRDYTATREKVLNQLISLGNTERSAERFDIAQAVFQQALQISPKDPRARGGMESVIRDRQHANVVNEAQDLFRKGQVDRATTVLDSVFLEQPNHVKAIELQRQINESEAKRLAAMPSMDSNFKKPVTLQFRDANLRMVFESLSRASGINILLDKDVKGDLRTSLFVRNVSVEDTIELILLQNQLRKKLLSGNTLYVYPNQPAKSKEYQELKVRSFHLVHTDAKLMLTMLKTMLKVKDIVVNEKTNSVIMRDTPEAIRLAEKIVADQDIGDPEVMLEVEVLEITHTLASELGIRYPGQITLTPSAPGGGPITVENIGSSFARNQLLVTPVPTFTFNASMTKSDTNVLASPRLRTRNKEKAKIHIGDRLPVFTNSVTPLATGAAVTTGTVQYVDTGIKLEVEPTINHNGGVSIKIQLEVSVASAPVTNPQSGTTAYPISTRSTATVLQLKDGETNVLAGLIRDSEVSSKVMIPGLGEVPVIGRIFGSKKSDDQKTEIILSITPRLMSKANMPSAKSLEFWSGTETTLRSEPFLLSPAGSVSINSDAAAGALGTPPRGVPVPPPPRSSVLPGLGAAPRPTPPVTSAQTASETAEVQDALTLSLQGPAQAKVGSKLTVTLNARATQAVGTLGVSVTYDPALLKALEVTDGSLVGQGGPTTKLSKDIDATSGQVALELTNATDQGVKGAGAMATVTFEVLSAGEAQIAVERISPSGPKGENVNFTIPTNHAVNLSQ